MRVICSGLVLALLGSGSSAQADDSAHSFKFNIPRQLAGPALQAFSQTTGLQVGLLVDEVKASELNAVAGELDAARALALMLEGSGYTYRFVNARTVAIYRAHAVQRVPAPVVPATATPGPDKRTTPAPTVRRGVAAFLVALVSSFSALASAQDSGGAADPVASGELVEVIVSARRRDENLQDVPLSIAAITGQSLVERGLGDLSRVAAVTPGLDYFDFGGGFNSAPIIRGLSQINSLVGEANVGVFLDGVYIADRSGVNLAFLDLQRVEVVKGPQSALYGRNTFAGAINYVTEKPSDEFAAKGRVTVGGDNKVSAIGTINGAFGESGLTGRLTLGYDRFDGSNVDRVHDQTIGGGRNTAGQGWLSWKPIDSLEILAGAYVADFRYEPVAAASQQLITGNNCAPSGPTFRAYCGTLLDGSRLAPQTAGLGVETAGDGRTRFWNLRTRWSPEVAQVDWVIAGERVSAFRDREFNALAAGLPYRLSPGPGTLQANFLLGGDSASKNWSTELRVASNSEGRVKWAAGAYYYDFSIDSATLFAVGPAILPPGQAITAPPLNVLLNGSVSRTGAPGPLKNRSVQGNAQWSAFASGDLEILTGLTLGLQARYTDERKTSDTISIGTLNNADPDGPGLSGNFRYTDWRVSLDYKLRPRVLAYASAARGTHAGGFNSNATVAQDRLYAPEKNITYEVGLKTSWFDSRLKVNAAAYSIRWSDLQLTGFNSDPANPSPLIKNFASADNDGLELEINAAPFAGLNISVSGSVSNAKFGDDVYSFGDAANCALIPSCAPRVVSLVGPQGTPRSVMRLGGLKLPRQSPVQTGASIDYSRPLPGTIWSLIAGADYSSKSSQRTDNNNFAVLGDRQLLNLRIGGRSDRLTLQAYVDNALDDLTPVLSYGGQLRFNDFSNEVVVILPQGRTYGLTFMARY